MLHVDFRKRSLESALLAVLLVAVMAFGIQLVTGTTNQAHADNGSTFGANLLGLDADDGKLEASVQYEPKKIGGYADLVAVVSRIAPSWSYRWEVWPVGKSESEASIVEDEAEQTLRVKTDYSAIGNQYRVTICNDEHEAIATSPWVMLKTIPRNDWSVVLSYNPPKMGDLAIIRANTYGYEGDASKLTYTWQLKTGNGNWYTPSKFKNVHEPVLKLSTTPVSAGDAETPAGLVDLSYIRVLVDTKSASDKAKYEPMGGWPNSSNAQPFTVRVRDEQTITATNVSKVIGCKPFRLKAKASANGKLTFTSSNPAVASVGKTSGKVIVKKAGVAKIKICAAAKGGYDAAEKTVTLKVYKANTLRAKAKTVTASSSATTVVNADKAFSTGKSKGAIRYKKLSGSKKITISPSGAVKVKAGLKAGAYKVRVKVAASGNKTYAPTSATVTLKVLVK